MAEEIGDDFDIFLDKYNYKIAFNITSDLPPSFSWIKDFDFAKVRAILLKKSILLPSKFVDFQPTNNPLDNNIIKDNNNDNNNNNGEINRHTPPPEEIIKTITITSDTISQWENRNQLFDYFIHLKLFLLLKKIISNEIDQPIDQIDHFDDQIFAKFEEKFQFSTRGLSFDRLFEIKIKLDKIDHSAPFQALEYVRIINTLSFNPSHFINELFTSFQQSSALYSIYSATLKKNSEKFIKSKNDSKNEPKKDFVKIFYANLNSILLPWNPLLKPLLQFLFVSSYRSYEGDPFLFHLLPFSLNPCEIEEKERRGNESKLIHAKIKFFRGFLLPILIYFLENQILNREIDTKSGKEKKPSPPPEKDFQYLFAYLFSRNFISIDEFFHLLLIRKILITKINKINSKNKKNNNNNNDNNNDNNNNDNNNNNNKEIERIYKQMENFVDFVLFLKRNQLENYFQYEKYFPYFDGRLFLSPSLASIALDWTERDMKRVGKYRGFRVEIFHVYYYHLAYSSQYLSDPISPSNWRSGALFDDDLSFSPSSPLLLAFVQEINVEKMGERIREDGRALVDDYKRDNNNNRGDDNRGDNRGDKDNRGEGINDDLSLSSLSLSSLHSLFRLRSAPLSPLLPSLINTSSPNINNNINNSNSDGNNNNSNMKGDDKIINKKEDKGENKINDNNNNNLNENKEERKKEEDKREEGRMGLPMIKLIRSMTGNIGGYENKLYKAWVPFSLLLLAKITSHRCFQLLLFSYPPYRHFFLSEFILPFNLIVLHNSSSFYHLNENINNNVGDDQNNIININNNINNDEMKKRGDEHHDMIIHNLIDHIHNQNLNIADRNYLIQNLIMKNTAKKRIKLELKEWTQQSEGEYSHVYYFPHPAELMNEQQILFTAKMLKSKIGSKVETKKDLEILQFLKKKYLLTRKLYAPLVPYLEKLFIKKGDVISLSLSSYPIIDHKLYKNRFKNSPDQIGIAKVISVDFQTRKFTFILPSQIRSQSISLSNGRSISKLLYKFPSLSAASPINNNNNNNNDKDNNEGKKKEEITRYFGDLLNFGMVKLNKEGFILQAGTHRYPLLLSLGLVLSLPPPS